MQTSPPEKNQYSNHKNSTAESKLLKIEREFDVSVDQLFEAFSSLEELKIWWWPNGLFSDHIDCDFREGGKYFINMKGHVKGINGTGGMTGRYEEIIKNKRIVMTDFFADAQGNAISPEKANMPGVWPEEIYITFDFESVDAHTSLFTLSQQGIPNDMQQDCIQGWSESFDKLESYLNGRKL